MISTPIQEGYRLREERRFAMPHNIIKSNYDQSTTPDPEEDLWNKYEVSHWTPVWHVHSSNVSLHVSKPINLKIVKGEEFFVAENETLGIFVTGESSEKAIDAFCEQIIHYWKHYKNLDWNKVIGHGKYLKRIYEQLFQEISS